jgi:hypothetical protein
MNTNCGASHSVSRRHRGIVGEIRLPKRRIPQKCWRPLGDLNPCYRRERAVSWATRRRGPQPERPLIAESASAIKAQGQFRLVREDATVLPALIGR